MTLRQIKRRRDAVTVGIARQQAFYSAADAELFGDDDEPVDQYGNPLSGDRIINCCFPDCGCDGSRLCMAEKGASSSAKGMNLERGSLGLATR